jgi:hypothetical protein
MEYLENLNLGYVFEENNLCPDMGDWESVVNTAVNLQFPSKARIFFGWLILSFRKLTLLHEIG